MLKAFGKEYAPEKILVFDTETTGLMPEEDELLQVSIINGNGATVFNEYIKPVHHASWEKAQEVHGITPEMVADKKTIDEYGEELDRIFGEAELLVSYNGGFDKSFLKASNISVPEVEWYDVMKVFAPIYGEWNEEHETYRWQRLVDCAKFFDYEFHAHNSLEDSCATLYCMRKIEELRENAKINEDGTLVT